MYPDTVGVLHPRPQGRLESYYLKTSEKNFYKQIESIVADEIAIMAENSKKK